MKNRMRIASLFMIVLVVMFPVYSASAMAEISRVSTYDSSMVDGYIEPESDLTVEAYARVSGDEDITSDQVKLGQTEFSSCTNPDPERRFRCIITIPTVGFLLDRPSQTYTVYLYDDSGSLIDSEPATITMDELSPQITGFDAPELVGSSEFEIEYDVTDPTDSENGCSGIGWLEFLLGGQAFDTIIINESSCSDSGTLAFEGNDLYNGENTLSMKAYDRLGHASNPESADITAELTEVSIKSLQFTDAQDNVRQWFVSYPMQLTLIANFSGPSIQEDTVEADLSDINPSYTTMQQPDTCQESDRVTSCSWDVTVDIDSAKTAETEFQMQDYAGNDVTKSASVQMLIDTQGPSTSLVRSAYYDGGVSYARPYNNKFIVRIIENADLDESKIKLYLGNRSRGTSSFFVKPTSCYESGIWQCNFTGIDLSGLDEGTYDAYILSDSRDYYDNFFTNNFSARFTMDRTAPEIRDINVKIIGGVQSGDRDYVQIGDSLEITANITESNALGEVYADFSNIISGEDESLPSCSKGTEGWTCTWQTDIIDAAYYAQTDISFYFSDAAGNTASESLPIEVYGVEETDAAIWSLESLTSSPDAIDREIVTLYEPFIWFIAELRTSDSNVIPIDVELGSCGNAESGGNVSIDAVSFISEKEVHNYNTVDSPESSTYPVYIKFNLIQAAPEQGSISFSCPITVRGIKNRQTIVYSSPIDISFEIDYFNNPLGTIDKNVDNEIERVKESWLVKAEWLGVVDKLMSYANLICRITNIYIQITQMWAGIKDVWSGACKTGIFSASCGESIRTSLMKKSSDKATEKWYSDIANKYCKMLNCQYNWDEEAGDKSGLMGAVSKVTGGADYVQKIKGSGKDRNAWLGNLRPDIQNSLILSALYLCLPGIIYNLQKARAIDCVYINCLEDVEEGMPIGLCTSQRAYAYCKFVYGEIFHLVPFASAISTIGQNVLKALSHPLEMIGFVGSTACDVYCSNPAVDGCWACSVAEFLSMTMSVLCDLGIGSEQCEPIWKNLNVGEDACTEALGEPETDEVDDSAGGSTSI